MVNMRTVPPHHSNIRIDISFDLYFVFRISGVPVSFYTMQRGIVAAAIHSLHRRRRRRQTRIQFKF